MTEETEMNGRQKTSRMEKIASTLTTIGGIVFALGAIGTVGFDLARTTTEHYNHIYFGLEIASEIGMFFSAIPLAIGMGYKDKLDKRNSNKYIPTYEI